MSWFSSKSTPLSSVSSTEIKVANTTGNTVARKVMKNRMVAKLPTGNEGSNQGKYMTYKNKVFGVNRVIAGNTRNINTWKNTMRLAATKGGKTRRRRNHKNRK